MDINKINTHLDAERERLNAEMRAFIVSRNIGGRQNEKID